MNSDLWHDTLYGRDSLLTELQTAYRRAASGEPQFVVLLSGTAKPP